MRRSTRTLDRENEGLFLIPALIFVCGIIVVPLFIIIQLSLTKDGALTTAGYGQVLNGQLFWRVLRSTLEISIISTLASLAIAYPIALHLSTVSEKWRRLCMILVLLPFWTSILVKSFAFIIVLGHGGLINNTLRNLFGEQAVVPMLFNRFGVVAGMAHYLVPFAVLLILSNLMAQDKSVKQAAEVMGANSWQIFSRITFPQSIPGVAAAGVTCFVISVGFFITPSLLGGRQDWMLGNLIDLFTRETLNWTHASVLAVLLLAVITSFLLVMSRIPGAMPRVEAR